ncbi:MULTISPECIES: VWA domain-containing protein [Micromonospora]|uniref:VWFA domain-containing protein n=1 Tax=Micromonospora sicca TaxID=2202420 RepID=A0A317DBK2_9ACTN|nr:MULTISPECIES: VWA domain-containing protein [unclassified Micromonospora]MBM0226914.1 VWA domain-containing protein [Micromonospora sp. ATA51]PWR11672.1 hypothetical protein DKT69_26190 [Micromonospora sp. 4G51]
MNPALATEVGLFARAVREAGITIEPARVAAAVAALSVLSPPGVCEVYWATRLTFCSRHADLVVFNAAFARWFGAAPPGPDEEDGVGSTQVGLPVAVEDGSRAAAGEGAVARAADGTERISDRSARTFGPEEAAEIDALVALLAAGTGLRRSRRRVSARRRVLDPRRTALSTLRGGGDLTRLCYRRPDRRPRRLVLLLDVSGSMERHVEPLLRLAYAAVTVAPATTEVFALGTRLTRITPALRHRDPAVAMRAVDVLIIDRAGGTRLGQTLRQFLGTWGGRRAARAAVTVIASDGWVTDADVLGEQMRRLSRIAHRVFWIEPNGGGDAVVQFVPGLRASREFVDHFVDGHEADAVRRLVHLLVSRRGACRPV